MDTKNSSGKSLKESFDEAIRQLERLQVRAHGNNRRWGSKRLVESSIAWLSDRLYCEIILFYDVIICSTIVSGEILSDLLGVAFQVAMLNGSFIHACRRNL
jgi:hypothetical protein